MRAGRLRDKVTIEAPPTNDNYGQPVGSWATVKTRSCDIQPLNGKEVWGEAGETSFKKVTIRFRYEKNLIKANYRIVDNRTSPQTIYDIDGPPINPGNENRELIVTCILRQ